MTERIFYESEYLYCIGKCVHSELVFWRHGLLWDFSYPRLMLAFLIQLRAVIEFESFSINGVWNRASHATMYLVLYGCFVDLDCIIRLGSVSAVFFFNRWRDYFGQSYFMGNQHSHHELSRRARPSCWSCLSQLYLRSHLIKFCLYLWCI